MVSTAANDCTTAAHQPYFVGKLRGTMTTTKVCETHPLCLGSSEYYSSAQSDTDKKKETYMSVIEVS